MSNYLTQLRVIKDKHSVKAKAPLPIIYAGDIFDRSGAPPKTNPAELINFAMKWLPDGYAIAGNHDLPFHRYKDVSKSSYWSLVEARVLKNLIPNTYEEMNSGLLVLHAFPCGSTLKPNCDKVIRSYSKRTLHVAIVHAYIWKDKNTSYPGAPKECNFSAYTKQLKGYHAAFAGDNHKGFLAQTTSGCRVMNCGGFIPMKSDERDYIPHVGVLMSDGTIIREKLDTAKDQWYEPEEIKGLEETEEFNAEEFLKELSALGDKAIDFARVLRHKAQDKNLSPQVQELLLRALE